MQLNREGRPTRIHQGLDLGHEGRLGAVARVDEPQVKRIAQWLLEAARELSQKAGAGGDAGG